VSLSPRVPGMSSRGAQDAEGTPQCLSMHQPWASLLVHGIKRVEGRGWPTDHQGTLWIASTAQEPDSASIQVGSALLLRIQQQFNALGPDSRAKTVPSLAHIITHSTHPLPTSCTMMGVHFLGDVHQTACRC
jgi:hypothetical protein